MGTNTYVDWQHTYIDHLRSEEHTTSLLFGPEVTSQGLLFGG